MNMKVHRNYSRREREAQVSRLTRMKRDLERAGKHEAAAYIGSRRDQLVYELMQEHRKEKVT